MSDSKNKTKQKKSPMTYGSFKSDGACSVCDLGIAQNQKFYIKFAYH